MSGSEAAPGVSQGRLGRGSRSAVAAYFSGRPESRVIYDAARDSVIGLADVKERVTRNEIAFWRAHPFAWLWIPGKVLRAKDMAPLVLSIGLLRHDRSAPWKEVVEPSPGRFMHHIELRSPNEIDERMRGLLREAWDGIGAGRRPRKRS